MMKNWINPFWIGSVVLGFWANITTVSAQVVPDNTLPVNSQVTGCPVCLIEGGTVRGVNLFHSFEAFSVQTGGEAFFNNALQIENIFGRVTGSKSSDIDGLIRANGTANLFLINPNGIIFEENARLNVGGSFAASTANAIGFGNQGVFSAADPEALPLLTVNPDAFLFNQLANQGTHSIEVRGSLSVPSGESLLIVAGNIAPDVTATGKLLIDGATLEALGGRVELAGVGASGKVELVTDSGSLGLNFPAEFARTDISIFDSNISVRGADQGNVVIYPNNLSIVESQILAGIGSGLGFADAQAGNITIDATGTVALEEGMIRNDVKAGARGRGGNISIAASSIFLKNDAQISSSTFGEGNKGQVIIRATNKILFDDSNVFSQVESGAKGDSQGVVIETGSLTLTNGARISASTFGEGDAGQVVIRASDKILFDDGDVFSQVESGAKGNSQGVVIETGSLTLTNGARISASTFG
ncbi:filamentous hemagglutinin N-terminal domain-containing protein, partial [Coleofasciculus sp.]|uniref:filamentous hemagglutinin N-terminal domain-containing protein n=1 Tax=Coleofasciculus sp. TaxID=3100458 RepID=UPI0039F8DDED